LKPPTSIPIYNLHVLFNYVDSKTVCNYDALLFTSSHPYLVLTSPWFTIVAAPKQIDK
jgi:hypothetical protein